MSEYVVVLKWDQKDGKPGCTAGMSVEPDANCYICNKWLQGCSQEDEMADGRSNNLYYVSDDNKRTYCRECLGEFDKQIIGKKRKHEQITEVDDSKDPKKKKTKTE